MSKFDVIGFGALNVDRLFKVGSIASAEGESFVTSFEETCGGSAANTIVGLARLNCKTGFIGKAASDREGKMLLEAFHTEGVDTKGVTLAKNGRSGTVMGFIDERGSRALYVDPGANDTLSYDEIPQKYAFQTKFLHLTSFVGEKPFNAQKKLLQMLPDTVKVSFDPGALYSKLGLVKLKQIIRRTFVLLPNACEVALLTDETDYRAGAGVLLGEGVRIVAVKLGGRGCYVTDGKKSCMVDSFKVKAVDTTGAGDAFNAGFLHGLINGKSLLDCGRIANFVASKCVTKIGARTGLPRLRDLAFL
jgi:ribokinase